MHAVAIALLLAACVDTTTDRPDAGDVADAFVEPTTCEAFEALTIAAPEIGEVKLAGAVRTPGVSYQCHDPSSPAPTTWSYWTRRRVDDARLGSYGRWIPGSDACRWFDAVDSRTPALGTCIGVDAAPPS